MPAFYLLILSDITIELNIHCDVVSRELPGIKVKPVIRDFDLVTIDNLLLEDTISVSKTITPCRVVERGKTIEEAGGQPSKATIAKSGIMLLGDDILDPESEFGKTG